VNRRCVASPFRRAARGGAAEATCNWQGQAAWVFRPAQERRRDFAHLSRPVGKCWRFWPTWWHMPNCPTGIVAIVDDDVAVRTALSRLLGASGIRTRTYASAREFLNSLVSETPGCLILDLQMPGM